jgi:high-affinity iron transporter
MVELFSVPAFFILFRETFEASIILSVMLTLIKKLVPEVEARRRMTRQVWWGVGVALALCLITAAVFLSLYYTVAKEAWEQSEALWEGVLGLIAVVLITLMALSMIRIDTWHKKWEMKLTKVTTEALAASASHRTNAHNSSNADGNGIKELEKEEVQEMELTTSNSKRKKYALFLIPFTMVLREGVEAVIFLGGIGLEGSGTAYPIPAVVGAACGILIGYLLYKGGSRAAFKLFLHAATLLLLVIAAGLFVGSVHEFEEYTHRESFVWKLECCNQNKDNVWAILNTLVGWRNEATRGTLSAYISYWLFVILVLVFLRWKWRRDDAARQSAHSSLPI